MTDNELIRSLWAKSDPYCSLIDHLIDTGDCAVELQKNGILRDVAQKLSGLTGLNLNETISLVGYIASLHDIGKAHPFFQAKNTSLAGVAELKKQGLLNLPNLPGFRHEEYSGEILKTLLPDVIEANEEFIKAIICAVQLHHQGKHKSEKTWIPKSCNPGKWETLHRTINEILLQRFHPPKRPFNGDSDAVIYLIMGIVILSDWIASGKREETIKAAIERCGLGPDESRLEFTDFCSLWSFIPKTGMRGVQKIAEELGRNPARLYIIEAPMGEGKSEAALYLAMCQMKKYNADGFYLALPTSATGNQMYSRVNDLFRQHDMRRSRLLHGTAWMIDDVPDVTGNEPEPETVEWLAPLRRAMLSRFAVGTVDQAMLSVMQVKYGVLRLLGLANKVLILDEIHAYDTYMQTIIERLLEWCKALQIPVILLSATLPKSKKAALLRAYGANVDGAPETAYPLITVVKDGGTVLQIPAGEAHMQRQYDIDLRPFMNSVEEIADLAIEQVKDGGCVCVLVNTVDRAQKVYARLLHLGTDAQLDLFHARFNVGRRNEIERTVVGRYGKDYSKRPKKSILVGTQVLEQSIDADFDAMITDLAPVDLLLQRMGRVHRFDNTVRPASLKVPRITVLTTDTGYDDTTVYPGILMQRTENLLSGLNEIRTPGMIRELVKSVYDPAEEKDADNYDMWAKHEFQMQLESAKAEGSVLPKPEPDYPSFADSVPDFFKSDAEGANYAAKTRIGDGSRRVILIDREELRNVPQFPTKQQAKELMLRSASIRTQRFGTEPEDAKVIETGLMKGVILLPTDNGVAHWGEYAIHDDPELGIIFEKE